MMKALPLIILVVMWKYRVEELMKFERQVKRKGFEGMGVDMRTEKTQNEFTLEYRNSQNILSKKECWPNQGRVIISYDPLLRHNKDHKETDLTYYSLQYT